VGRKRQAFQQKLRTREHIIADLAVNHVEHQGLLCGYSLERIVHDYGLDLVLFTYNEAGELEDGCVYLQVKGTEEVRRLRTGEAITFRAPRSDVQTWLRRLMPVILLVYDVSADCAYWLYVQRYFAQLPGFNVFAAAETLTLRLPAGQVLTPDAMRQFAAFRDKILGQIGHGVHHD
jgi:hypothetical protein